MTVSHVARASGPTEPAAVLLRGAVLPTLAVATLAVLVSLPAGPDAVLGALVGGALVVVALAAGPLLQRASARWQPAAVMAVALLTYGAIVIALGVAYTLLDDVAWLSQRHLGLTALACTVVWLGGQLRAATRLRVLAFGAEPLGKDRSP